MGAWGHGHFDNDDALDWVGALAEGRVCLTGAFDAALAAGERGPNTWESTEALAAAEVVAALLSRPARDPPDGVTAWVAGKPRPTPAMIDKASRAVRRVLDSSELRDLWTETPYSARWRSMVKRLLARLAEPAE